MMLNDETQFKRVEMLQLVLSIEHRAAALLVLCVN